VKDRIDRRRLGSPVLVASSLVLALLTTAVAVVATITVVSLSRDHSVLQDHNVPYAVAISTAALNAKGIANDERGFLISGRREFLDEIEQRLLDARSAFSAAAVAADGDLQRRAVADAEAGFERWVWALQRQFRTFQSGDRKGATKAALGPGRALRKDYEASLAEAQSVATTAIQLRRNPLASSGWVFTLLATLILMLVVGSCVTFWYMRALQQVASDVEEPEPATASVSLLAPPTDRLRRRNG
jgi:CHASE3 domain sensor protein